MFSTELWRQCGASQGNGGNALVLAGLNQWGAPFADMLAYSINTEGQGARPVEDGMDAFGFPWCVFGRAPNTEEVENEFPLLVPLSNHWKDSCGHGKYRGGVGTVQMWVAHHIPVVYMMAIADNSKLQTPQPLFGGYAPCTVPGIGIRSANVKQLLAEGNDKLNMDLNDLLTKKPIAGAHSIWEIVLHVAAWDNESALALGGKEYVMLSGDADWPPAHGRTGAGVRSIHPSAAHSSIHSAADHPSLRAAKYPLLASHDPAGPPISDETLQDSSSLH